jgi:hypothetical protein
MKTTHQMLAELKAAAAPLEQGIKGLAERMREQRQAGVPPAHPRTLDELRAALAAASPGSLKAKMLGQQLHNRTLGRDAGPEAFA